MKISKNTLWYMVLAYYLSGVSFFYFVAKQPGTYVVSAFAIPFILVFLARGIAYKTGDNDFVIFLGIMFLGSPFLNTKWPIVYFVISAIGLWLALKNISRN